MSASTDTRPPAEGPGRRRSPAAGRQPTVGERAERALHELRKLCHAVLDELGSDRNRRSPHLDLSLLLDLSRAQHERNDVADAAALLEQVRRALADSLQGSGAYRAGRVYCFLCESLDCPHATTPDPAWTFSGYTPTGKPEWQSFANLCLERGDERVDRLYGDPPQVIAVVQGAQDLKEGLLAGFGRDSVGFNLLGQVTAGLIPSTIEIHPEAGNADRFALTLQVVETRTGAESRRLRVNVLGVDLEHILSAAAEGEARGPAEALRRTVRAARERIDGLGRRVHASERRGRPVELEREVESLLTRLKGDLERIFRSGQRRTRHAQERHLGGERPTSNAVSDALQATDERFFLDAERDTVIVLGARGRVHVFTRQGRHVTSLQLERGGIERRTDRARWRPLPRETVNSFRRMLGQRD